MASVAIGTAGAISAYFFGRAFSSYSVNEPDSVMKHLPSLPYFPWVFGCGLIFWLLVLLWPNLCYSNGVVSLRTGSEDPQRKDINQLAKLNTVITVINMCGCLVLSAREVSLLVRYLFFFQMTSNLALLLFRISWLIYKYTMSAVDIHKRILGSTLEGGSGRNQGSAVIKISEGGSGGDAAGGGRGASGGGGGGRGGGGGGDGGDPGPVVREMNNEPTLRISKISELTITVTAQTTASLIGFHLTSESSLSKYLLSVAVAVQVVAFFCGLMSMLLASENPAATQVFDNIALVCYTLGHILMVAMFVPWWLVLIITLFFGGVCIFFFQRQVVAACIYVCLRTCFVVCHRMRSNRVRSNRVRSNRVCCLQEHSPRCSHPRCSNRVCCLQELSPSFPGVSSPSFPGVSRATLLQGNQ